MGVFFGFSFDPKALEMIVEPAAPGNAPIEQLDRKSLVKSIICKFMQVR